MAQLLNCISNQTKRKLCLKPSGELFWSDTHQPLPVTATAEGIVFNNGTGIIAYETSQVDVNELHAPKVIPVYADAQPNPNHSPVCLHRTHLKERHYILGTKYKEAALIDYDGYESVVIQQPPAHDHLVYFETHKQVCRTTEDLVSIFQQQSSQTAGHLVPLIDDSRLQQSVHTWIQNGTLQQVNSKVKLYYTPHSSTESIILSLALRNSSKAFKHSARQMQYSEEDITRHKQIADSRSNFIVVAPLVVSKESTADTLSSTSVLYHSLGGATKPQTWMSAILAESPQNVIIDCEDTIALSIVPLLAEQKVRVIVVCSSLKQPHLVGIDNPYVFVQLQSMVDIVSFYANSGTRNVVIVRANNDSFIDGPHPSCLLHNSCFSTNLMNASTWHQMQD